MELKNEAVTVKRMELVTKRIGRRSWLKEEKESCRRMEQATRRVGDGRRRQRLGIRARSRR